MKKFKNIFLIVVTGVLFTGCYGEDNWLADNWEKTGRHYPNISDVTGFDAQSSYSVGDEVHFDIRFWSEDPVESITLYHQYGDIEQEVATMYSYSDAGYSEVTQTDSLIIDYVVPQDASGTTINFEVVVENENGLSSSSTDATNTAIHNLSIQVE